MKKKLNKKDLVSQIFFAICAFLSIVVFDLMRRLNGEPFIKMMTDILVIVLLLVLNTAVWVLYHHSKDRDE